MPRIAASMVANGRVALSTSYYLPCGVIASLPDQRDRCLRVPDGQPAGRVEEVQVVRVDGEFSRLTRPDPAAGRNAGRPQRLAADQRGHGRVVIIVPIGRLREVRV